MSCENQAERVKMPRRAGRWAASVMVLCAVWGSASVARADEVSLQLGGGTQRVNDQGFDGISRENRQGNFLLELGYVSEALSPDLELLLLFNSGGAAEPGKSNFDGAQELDWRLQRVMVGADWGPTIGRFFRPAIRLGGGYVHQRLGMLDGSGERLFDHAHDVVGFAAVGARLMVPLSLNMGDPEATRGPLLKLGAQGYWGYQAQTRADFDELRSAQDESSSWDYAPLDLGSLSMRGRYVNLGVFVQLAF